MTSALRFTLTATDYASLINEARRIAAIEFPEWDFDSVNDVGRQALDIYLRAQAQEIEIGNGWSQEAFLVSCRLRESAVAHAISRGYRPRNPVPSVGEVSLEVEPDAGIRNIEQFSIRLSTRNFEPTTPHYFENAESFSIPANATEIEPEFVAGISVEETYISNGLPDQSYDLQQLPVIDNSIQIVDDNDDDWTYVTDFVDSEATDLHFTTQFQTDGGTRIIFGDGTNGKNPTTGLVFTIRYRVGGGLDTNVIPEAIQTVEVQPVGLVITTAINVEKFNGGDDAESLEAIQKNAPTAVRRALRTLGQVTDIVLFAEAYAGVSRAFGQLLGGLVLLSVIPVGGGTVSLTLKNNLEAAIAELIMMGYTCIVQDSIYISPTISVEFTTSKGYDSEETANLVKLRLLRFLDPTDFVIVSRKKKFSRNFGQAVSINGISAVMQEFVTAGAIEADFSILLPTTDLGMTANQIATNIGATVTATSRNEQRVVYKV